MPAAEQKWAYQTAVADINKKGGVFVKELNKKLPIKLILADDKSVADGAAAAMERLIRKDKIDFGLSSDTTPKNLAAATVTEKYKVFFSISRIWPEVAEEQNFKLAVAYFFSPFGAAAVPFKIWDMIPEAERIKRPVLFMEDNEDGQAFGEAFKANAEKMGYKFVMTDPFPIGAKDYSSQVLKMKALEADAVLWLGNATDGVTLLREIDAAQTKIRYVHGWRGMWPTEFLEAMGDDADYVVHDGFWSEKNGAPGAKELGARYMKEFGKDSVSIGQDYANVQMLAMAIEKAGSLDSEKVHAVYVNGEFNGTTQGNLKFNEKGVCYFESLAMQWWKGERMPIWPPNKELWTLKLKPVK
jgi:branched-chain amino acid transport system substrate-binding protein